MSSFPLPIKSFQMYNLQYRLWKLVIEGGMSVLPIQASQVTVGQKVKARWQRGRDEEGMDGGVWALTGRVADGERL